MEGTSASVVSNQLRVCPTKQNVPTYSMVIWISQTLGMQICYHGNT